MSEEDSEKDDLFWKIYHRAKEVIAAIIAEENQSTKENSQE